MKHFAFKSPKGKCVRKVAVLSLCFAMFAGSLPAQDISASIRIYYPETKKTVTYNDALITYKYNDMVLELNGLKGILTDHGVALGPYYELSKALGISYSKSGSTITLKYTCIDSREQNSTVKWCENYCKCCAGQHSVCRSWYYQNYGSNSFCSRIFRF